MTDRLVTSTIDDGVGELRLTHAPKRNAVGPEMVAQAFEAMDGFARAGVKVAVLSADAPVFCAGNDLDELGTLISIADFSVTRLVHALLERPLFWVAAVDGPALGGGMALVAACPMVVVSDRASFVLPELNVGLFPAGVLQYLEVVMGPRAALDAGVTGRRIEAPEAVQRGLAREVVAPERLSPHTRALATELASRPAVTDAAREAWQAHFATVAFADRQALLDGVLRRGGTRGDLVNSHPRQELE